MFLPIRSSSGVDKPVFLVEHYVKAELYKTAQSNYSHGSECPAPGKSVMAKNVTQFKLAGNVSIQKRVRRSSAVTRVAEASGRLNSSPQRSLRKLA
jgi:hypothetical protein